MLTACWVPPGQSLEHGFLAQLSVLVFGWEWPVYHKQESGSEGGGGFVVLEGSLGYVGVLEEGELEDVVDLQAVLLLVAQAALDDLPAALGEEGVGGEGEGGVAEGAHAFEDGLGGGVVVVGGAAEDHAVEDDAERPGVALVGVLLAAEHLRGHEHGAADHALGVGEAGGHPEVDHLGPALLGQVHDVLQLEVAVVDAHCVQRADALQQVAPQPAGLLLAELVAVADHVVVEVAAAWEVLGDDVVVGLGLEEVHDADHLRDRARLLQRHHLRLILQERLLRRLHLELVHLLQRKLAAALALASARPPPRAIDGAPGARPQHVRGRVAVLADHLVLLVVHTKAMQPTAFRADG